MSKQKQTAQPSPEQAEARRRFLSKAGKFAVATPAAITVLPADVKGRAATVSISAVVTGGT